MATNPPSDPIHSSSTLADQLQCEAVAETWQQLRAAADAGDSEARTFLRTFEPFARERLGARRPS